MELICWRKCRSYALPLVLFALLLALLSTISYRSRYYSSISNLNTKERLLSSNLESIDTVGSSYKVPDKPEFQALDAIEAFIPDVSEIQKQRVATLKSFCKLHPELSGIERVGVKKKLIKSHFKKNGNKYSLLPSYKFFECRVAKTGTTMRSFVWWAAFHDGKNIHDFPYYHPVVDPDVQKMDKISVEEFENIMRTHTGAMFVREPVMKIISAYFNKFCDPKKKWIMKKHFGFGEGTEGGTPSLGDVLGKLASDETLEVYEFDDHFTSYFNYCSPCLVNYSFIGRFETLKRDLQHLLFNVTSLHNALSYPIDQAPVSPKFTDCPYTMDHPLAFQDVNMDHVLKLIRKYKYEYAAFSYDPSDIIKYIRKRIDISKDFRESQQS